MAIKTSDVAIYKAPNFGPSNADITVLENRVTSVEQGLAANVLVDNQQTVDIQNVNTSLSGVITQLLSIAQRTNDLELGAAAQQVLNDNVNAQIADLITRVSKLEVDNAGIKHYRGTVFGASNDVTIIDDADWNLRYESDFNQPVVQKKFTGWVDATVMKIDGNSTTLRISGDDLTSVANTDIYLSTGAARNPDYDLEQYGSSLRANIFSESSQRSFLSVLFLLGTNNTMHYHVVQITPA